MRLKHDPSRLVLLSPLSAVFVCSSTCFKCSCADNLVDLLVFHSEFASVCSLRSLGGLSSMEVTITPVRI